MATKKTAARKRNPGEFLPKQMTLRGADGIGSVTLKPMPGGCGIRVFVAAPETTAVRAGGKSHVFVDLGEPELRRKMMQFMDRAMRAELADSGGMSITRGEWERETKRSAKPSRTAVH